MTDRGTRLESRGTMAGRCDLARKKGGSGAARVGGGYHGGAL